MLLFIIKTVFFLRHYAQRCISYSLHPTDNIPAPILKEIGGRLYKLTSANGVSIIPNMVYTGGEVIPKDETKATVRLYADPNEGYDISYFDYLLVLEDGVWKHNPSF